MLLPHRTIYKVDWQCCVELLAAYSCYTGSMKGHDIMCIPIREYGSSVDNIHVYAKKRRQLQLTLSICVHVPEGVFIPQCIGTPISVSVMSWYLATTIKVITLLVSGFMITCKNLVCVHNVYDCAYLAYHVTVIILRYLDLIYMHVQCFFLFSWHATCSSVGRIHVCIFVNRKTRLVECTPGIRCVVGGVPP